LPAPAEHTLPEQDNDTALLAGLAVRFPFEETTWDIAGRRWSITAVGDQDALIESVSTEEELAQFPYGLLLWAAAPGLAQRLAQEPSLVAGKRVLEIGAGVGLPGLVAAHLGASVTQTDYQAVALALARRNAAQNGIPGVRVLAGDWRQFTLADEEPPFDVVLGSDVLYERSLHDTLRALLPRLIAPGGLLLVSDPLRPQVVEFMDRLEQSGSDWVSVTMESRNDGKPPRPVGKTGAGDCPLLRPPPSLCARQINGTRTGSACRFSETGCIVYGS
jgi:predicted nicotinamide N-methyase